MIPPWFLNNLFTIARPSPVPSGFGCDIGLKELLYHRLGEARTIVLHTLFIRTDDHPGLRTEGDQGDLTPLLPLQRLDSVFNEIVNNLTDTQGIGFDPGVGWLTGPISNPTPRVPGRGRPISPIRVSGLIGFNSICGGRAYSEKSLTMLFMASTCCTMVWVARSSTSASHFGMSFQIFVSANAPPKAE